MTIEELVAKITAKIRTDTQGEATAIDMAVRATVSEIQESRAAFALIFKRNGRIPINFNETDRVLGSKMFYSQEHPHNRVVFNAVLFTRERGKVWWGDLDLTLDMPDLIGLAKKLGQVVYVFGEHDGYEHECSLPRWNAAVAKISVPEE